MQFYPIFLKLKGETVVFSGGGEHAAAKIRLLMKAEAQILVFDPSPCNIVEGSNSMLGTFVLEKAFVGEAA